MHPKVAKLVKEFQYRTPLRRYFFPFYAYEFTVPQLMFLCQRVEETRGVHGAIAEVGCFIGATTVLLNKFMDARGIEKPYLALDTFAGFVPEDIRHEVTKRGKNSSLYRGFRANSRRWFDGTMQQNGIRRVQSIEADVNKYDLAACGPFSFVLLDVDLYRPTKKALPELYRALSAGGVIVVDDCDATNVRWDGADQAYKEFVREMDTTVEVQQGKLGVIRKPHAVPA